MSSVRPGTRRLYESAVAAFESFCSKHRCRISTMPELDRALERYFTECFFEGLGAAAGRNALYGFLLLRRPEWRDTVLTRTKRALKGWTAAARSQTGRPCPYEVMCLIGLELLNLGLALVAAAVAFQFDTYVRPSELLAVCHSDIVPPIPGTAFARRWGLLLAPEASGRVTKTGKTDGSIDIGGRIRPWLQQVMAALYQPNSPNPIWQQTLAQYEEAVRNAVGRLALTSLAITPHSFRHGGASHDRASGARSLDEIQKRGQWVSKASVARYEKEVVLASQLARLPPHRRAEAVAATTTFPRELLRHLRRCQG